jgi:hypothetical protein
MIDDNPRLLVLIAACILLLSAGFSQVNAPVKPAARKKMIESRLKELPKSPIVTVIVK